MKKLFFLFLILNYSAIHSQDVEISGFGATGMAIYDQNIFNGTNQESYYKGKLQVDLNITKDIESQLDFRGSSQDNSVTLREFSVKFKYSDAIRFKVGHIKKPFGYEYSVKIEDSKIVNRSYNFDMMSNIGFTNRSFGLMAYRNYKSKHHDLPISYYLMLFKNNSREIGISSRFSFHQNDLTYSMSYQFFNKGGNETINVHGIGIDVLYELKRFTFVYELAYLKDYQEGIIRRLHSRDENIFSFSSQLLSRYKFDSGYEVINKIEPVLGIGFYAPDSKELEVNNFQLIAGANLYFHKNVRLRTNIDIRLTKNKFSDEYSTETSNFISEIQVRF